MNKLALLFHSAVRAEMLRLLFGARQREMYRAEIIGYTPFAQRSVEEELQKLVDLELITTVNGAVRQRAVSADMVFPIPMLLSYISHIMTLEPGDLVATGTPSGISPLEAGDEVEVVITGVSRVRNPVRDAAR